MAGNTKSTSDKRNRAFLEVVNAYTSDHNSILTLVGVLAAVSGLFLNIDSEMYQNGLREIQLVLLVLLIGVLAASAISTFLWFTKEADSGIAALVSVTYFLLIHRLVVFVTENLRNELNEYMFGILGVVVLIVLLVARRMQTKIEALLRKYTIPKPILYSAATFIFLYMYWEYWGQGQYVLGTGTI